VGAVEENLAPAAQCAVKSTSLLFHLIALPLTTGEASKQGKLGRLTCHLAVMQLVPAYSLILFAAQELLCHISPLHLC